MEVRVLDIRVLERVCMLLIIIDGYIIVYNEFIDEVLSIYFFFFNFYRVI